MTQTVSVGSWVEAPLDSFDASAFQKAVRLGMDVFARMDGDVVGPVEMTFSFVPDAEVIRLHLEAQMAKS